MHSVPKLKIYHQEDVPDGVFEWGSSRNDLFDAYYKASDMYMMGEYEDAKAVLEDIISQDTHFIDAYNLLGEMEMDLGDLEQGREYHQKALQAGEQVIPDSFDGRIRWGFTENRPFLRALYSVALDHLTGGSYAECISLLEKVLQYNPDDNQGARFLIGDLYFLQNSFKKAETVYKNNLDYPPYLYSYGLLHFVLGNHDKAITCFRKGILKNIYISDLLRMKVPLIPYEIWHGTNWEMPETAYSYTDVMTQKWIDHPGAIDLLQFLHLAEPSHSEVQTTYMLKNELYFSDAGFDDEESFDIRGEILGEIDKILAGVTDASSKKILKRWKKLSQ